MTNDELPMTNDERVNAGLGVFVIRTSYFVLRNS